MKDSEGLLTHSAYRLGEGVMWKGSGVYVPDGTTPEMRYLDALMRRTVRGMTDGV